MDTKVHRKKSKNSQKTKRKKNISMVPNGDEASDAENIALDELHSLTHYAGDEEKLVDEMFAAIQGTKLEAMMPPVLKAIPLQDLKVLCVHELRGISKKRIVAIIQGRDMSDSSGSSDEEESGSEDGRPTTRKKRDGDSSRRHDKRGKSKAGVVEGDDGKPMDIVELEMRARLIQTMLKGDPKHKGGSSDPAVGDINIKNEPKSPHGSRSRSYSTSRSRSYSRSRSRSGSSYSSGSEGGHKRGSKRRSRRDRRHHRHRRGHGSSSKKREDKDGSVTPDRGEDGEAGKKRQQARKTKISRKEFEDRMRKAKENRTYRKRKDSEDEEKRSKEEEVPERQHHVRESKVKKEKVDVEEGEESEKEEGEIDSNEEEGSYYSDTNHKKSRHRSRSGSSYSSLSSAGSKRSPSKKRSKRSKDKRRSSRGDARKPVDKNLILATLNDDRMLDQAKGDSAKTKPGIETVDSEEDFDSLSGVPSRSVKLEPGTNMVPRTDRTNVSFCFNKKSQPTLAQGTDLEFGRTVTARPGSGLKPQLSRGSDQIVISSDSEGDAKSSKHRRSQKGGVAEGAVVIDDDTSAGFSERDAGHNTSDQNDLKLCEATVMKDIFADIDDDEDDDVTRIEVKRELIQQSDMMETDGPPENLGNNSAAENMTDRYTPPPQPSQIDLDSTANISIDTANESDVCVKREIVSPTREIETHPLPSIIKSEPWDDLGIPDQRELASAGKSRTKKGKKGKSKKTNKGGGLASEGLLDSSLEEVGARTALENTAAKESFSKSHSAGNDSEEGACTDQEADMNNSRLSENQTSINSPEPAHDPLTSSPVHHREDKVPEPSAADTSNLDSTYDNSPRGSRTMTPTPATHDQPPKDTNSNLDDPELSEEESGLVDLPEDEHFEIEDDDDNSRDFRKYDASALETLHRQLNDDEGNVDDNDFYRGADVLNFSKENSRVGDDDDEENTLASVLDQPENASEAEEGEVGDEEAAEDGGLVELVELQPEEAEELTALAETAQPLPRQGNTEIIGEIDPSMGEQEAEAQALGDTGSSWSSRWLQSEKVQKVVSSNKMLNRMRKRIIKNDKLNAAKSSPTGAVDSSLAVATDVTAAQPAQSVDAASDAKPAESESVPVIGSMEEYQKMLAEQEALPQEERGEDSAPATAEEPAEHSSEDSEDDELWSKMMGT